MPVIREYLKTRLKDGTAYEFVTGNFYDLVVEYIADGEKTTIFGTYLHFSPQYNDYVFDIPNQEPTEPRRINIIRVLRELDPESEDNSKELWESFRKTFVGDDVQWSYTENSGDTTHNNQSSQA